jgi:hypothetical protein
MVERADTHRYNKLTLERKLAPCEEPAHQKLSIFSRAIGRSESVALEFTGSGAGSGNSSETGARIMILSGERWLRTLLTALTVMIAPVSNATLFAQGYGPDPFKPYNSQYLPYTFPMGPASPAGGGGAGGVMMRMGNAGANQYQGYMDELSGQARQGSDRNGIGTPYYRSAVDPNFDPQGKREYRPNQKADQSFDESREVVTRKYLAYLTEHDPKKRAELLRDYNATRNRVSRAMSARRDPSTRLLEAATGSGTAPRRSAATARGAEANERSDMGDDGPRSSVRGPSTGSGRRAGTASIPPPPPLAGARSGRRTSQRRSPEDVLKRARRLDDGNDVKPSAGAPTGADSNSGRRPIPAPLPPD